MDCAMAQLDQARTLQGRWRKRFERVAGDARHLPLAQGTVRLSDGSPAAAARVELIPLPPRPAASRLLLAGHSGAEPVASATVDAAGRYRLQAPEAGVYRLRVRAPGHLPMQRVPLVLYQPVELAPAVLPRAGDSVVQAFDAGGRPLAGVRVWAVASDPPAQAPAGWSPAVRLLSTDREGRAVLPRAGSEALDVSLIGADGRIEIRRGVLERTVQLRLPAATAFASRQILTAEPGGQNLAEVIVHAGELAWPVGTTDGTGSLALLARRGLETPLLLVAADGRERAVRLAIDEAAPGEARAPTRFQFPDPVTVRGTVRDLESRRPLAGAVVWPGPDPGATVLTDAEGRFHLVAPRVEGFWLQAEAAGHLARRLRITSEHLGAGRGPRFELPAAARVAGRVFDTEGRPIAGVLLAAMAQRPVEPAPAFRFDPAAGRASSGDRGTFEIGGLEAGERYVLSASRPGYARGRVELTAPELFAAGLEIVLRPQRTVYGLVVDEAEEPLPGAVVVIAPAGRPLPARAPELEESSRSGARRFQARTDAEGRFDNLHVPAEVVDLTAFSEGFRPTTVRGLRIPAVPTVDLGSVVLLPGLSLRGRAVDAAGEGIPDVDVHVLRDADQIDHLMGSAAQEIARRRPDAKTDAGGEFTVAELREGERLDLLFRGAGYRAGWLRQVAVPTSEVLSIELERAASVRGRVIDEADEPIAGASVVLAWSELPAEDLPEAVAWLEDREVTTDAEGRFAFTEAPAGEATLHVHAEGFVVPEPLALTLSLNEETASGEVPSGEPPGEPSPEDLSPGEPPSGEPEEITITLTRGAVLEGAVTTAGGEPIPGTRVGCGGARAIADAGGLYRIAGVPIGRAAVEAYHDHYGRQVDEIEIEAGVNVRDISFGDGFAVTGRVLDDEGSPIVNAEIQGRSVRVDEHKAFRATSGEDGAFRLGPLANGRYRIQVWKTGYVPREQFTQVVVAGAPVEDVELAMVHGVVIRGRILGLDFDQLARVSIAAEAPGRSPQHGEVSYDGSYQIRDVAAGDWLLRATLDQGRRQAQARVSLPPGTTSALRDVEFTPGLVFDGRVLHDEEPVVGAMLTLRGYQLSVERSVTSDHQGAFRIDDLDPGRYHLELTHGRLYLVHNRDIELFSDRHLDIRLRPARLGGRVEILDDRRPLPAALVVLRRLPELGGEENIVTTGTDDDGRFSFPRVPAGSYALSVRKDGYAADEQSLDVSPGDRMQDLEISVRPTSGVRLDLRLATGQRPGQVTVAVLDAAGGTWLREIRAVSPEGRVDLATVPPGRWQLVLSSPGAAPARVAAEVPGEVLPVILRPAAQLRVRVPALAGSDQIASLRLFGLSGEPFRGLDESASLQEEWPVVAGKALVEHLPAGSWTLLVHNPDGQTWSGSVSVGAGMEMEIGLE